MAITPRRALDHLERGGPTCPAPVALNGTARTDLYRTHRGVCASIAALRHALGDAAPNPRHFRDGPTYQRAVVEMQAELALLDVLERRRLQMIEATYP